MNDYEKIFRDSAEEFKEGLSDQQITKFNSASAQSVKAQVFVIQREQDKDKSMINFNRMSSFLQALEQFDVLVKDLNPATANLSAYLWGPTKAILDHVKMDSGALDCVLESYEKFGQHLPLVSRYRSQLSRLPGLPYCLALLFHDLLKVNAYLLKLFENRNWRRTFKANWKDKHEPFNTANAAFDMHNRFLKGTAEVQHHEVTLEMNQNLNDFIQRSTRNDDELLAFARDQQVTNQNQNDHFRRYMLDREQLLSEARAQEHARKEAQYTSVFHWLRSPGLEQYEKRFQQKFLGIASGFETTGSWFLNSDVLGDWLTADDPEYPIIWVNGKMGAGKTILTSLLIEHVTKHFPERKCSYFYCREGDRDHAEPHVLAIKKSLLRQMTAHNRDLLPTFYEKKINGQDILADDNAANTLLDMFVDVGMDQFIIMDGLDELKDEDRDSIIKKLVEMVKKSDEHHGLGKVRVLLVSTDLASIRKLLASDERVREYSISTKDTQKDIEIFVDKRVEDLGEKHPTLNPEDLKRVKDMTYKNANGMFLYAFLVMDNFLRLPNGRSVRNVLATETFPDTLDKAYDKIINRLRSNDNFHMQTWNEARRIFDWLSYAKRPLKLYELLAAISIDFNDDGTTKIQDFGLRLREPIQDVCGSLIHVLGNECVEFIHTSAKKYIMNHESIDKDVVDCEMATRCLRYLSHPCFRKSIRPDGRERFVNRGNYAFQDYAISEWFEHITGLIKNSPMVFEDHPRRDEYTRKVSAALESFNAEYQSDLQSFSLEQREHKAETVEKAKSDCRAFEQKSFYESLLRIWTHILMHRRQPTKKHNQVSIKELGDVLKANREILERLRPDLDKPQTWGTLREFYGPNIFKCDKVTCPYFYEGFPEKKDLENHKNRHDRPFPCTVPGCSFVRFGFLTGKDRERHYRSVHHEIASDLPGFPQIQRRPMGETRHQCEECSRSFTRRVNLIAHQDSAHLGRRPHRCSTCDKAFTRKNDCRRHEKLHVRRRR